MSVLWALILLSAVGAVLCARSRAALPAAFFSVLAVVLLFFTPIGAQVLNIVTHLHVSTGPAGAGR
jgi:hypothetical protein